MHFQLQAKTAAGFASICQQDKWVKQQQQDNSFSYNNEEEPTSVLHMRRCQSPPTSASTLSSSFNGGPAAADGGGGGNFTDTNTNTTEFQPISSELDLVTAPVGAQRCNLGLDEWETMLYESAVSPSQDNNSLLRWISDDVDEYSYGVKELLQSENTGTNQCLDFECKAAGLGVVDQGPGFDPIGSFISSDPGNLGCFPGYGFVSNGNSNGDGIQNPMLTSPAESIGLHVSLPMLYQQQSQYLETQDMKPQNLHPQDPNFFMSYPQENHTLRQTLPKRLNHGNFELGSQILKLPFADTGHELFMRKQHHMGFPQQKPFIAQQQQQATLLDQLYKVAEMVETGNFSHAQGILARLNHNQLLSPVGKPFQRAAFYFKESLQLLLLMNNNNTVSPQHPRFQTPFDVIFKMGAYKVFSEVSPLIQFVNFTSNQALLEALDDADRIHILDFDIGFGAQWASFMQELPMRRKGVPSLRITAFSTPSTHHPIELGLMRENLTLFANEIGICFELEVLNLDSLHMFGSNENEAIAVNFPIWSASNQPSIVQNLLLFVKQLKPKIVVSLDRGFDRNDLPFPQHIIHAFQSCTNLLESLDAADTVTLDAVNKIERFLLVPRIETAVLGRMHALERMPLWKTLFASAGFTPLTFSNFTETQAECVVKRAQQARGFHVEKRHTSLVLCWQQRDLISASAWRC